MRIVKQVLIIALVLLLLGQIATAVYEGTSDRTEAPVIHCDDQVLEISISDTESTLRQGVTASDTQDGDLTDQIIIGNISKLTGRNAAKVTYLVFDSDHNMATFIRQVRYTDYEMPRFTVEQSLEFSSVDNITVSSVAGNDVKVFVGAFDVVDGDISHKVRASTLAQDKQDLRVYEMSVLVTNSLNDTAKLTLPVLVMAPDADRPTIALTEYLVYLEKDGSFDPMDYLVSVSVGDMPLDPTNVKVSHDVDMTKAGVYRARFDYSHNGNEGISFLTVVVQ